MQQPSKTQTGLTPKISLFLCLSILNIFSIISLFCGAKLNAQNIGINGTGSTAHPSALLDIDAVSTPSLGILIPRIALQAINVAAPVTSPATSLLVYNTASASTGTNAVSAGYYYWDGTKWVRFSYNSSGSFGDAWTTLGNSGTNGSTNFLGTTDAQDLVFRTNNVFVAKFRNNGTFTNSLLNQNIIDATGTGGNPGSLLWEFNNGGYAMGIANQSNLAMANGLVIKTVSTASNTSILDLSTGTQTLAGNPIMSVKSNGNVGIGTNIPQTTLHLYGGSMGLSVTPDLIIERYGNSGVDRGVGILFKTGTSGLLTQESAKISVSRYNGGVGTDMIFQVANDASVLDTMMLIADNGNVGIGTTTPKALLSVGTASTPQAGTITSAIFRTGIEVKSTGDSYIDFHNGLNKLWTIVTEGNPTEDQSFRIKENGSTPRFIILPGGNTGIGTLTPANKLEITQGTAGNSGLRFTNLPNASVLKTDANGDVVPATASTATNNGVFWSLLGNSGTNPTTNFLGTTDAQDLVFKTNNLGAVRITTAGNVGIGTASPANNLSVSGTSLNPTVAVFNINGAGGQNTTIDLRSNGITGLRFTHLNNAFVDAMIDHNYSLANSLIFALRGNEKMRILENGNVGIGTPAPLVKLQIEGASNNLMNLVNTSSSINVPAWQNYIQFGDGTLNAGYVGEGSGGKLMSLVGHYGHGVTLASFQNNTATSLNCKIDLLPGGNSSIVFNTKLSDRMIIDSIGNVGIGTTTPYSKLDVNENAGTSEVRITSGTPVKYGELIFSSNNSAFLNRGASIEGNGEGVGIDVGALIFKTQYGIAPRTEQMRINSIGNVGIGTTTPGDKLSVFGRGEFVTTIADHGVRVKGDPTNAQSIYQFTNHLGTIQWANIMATPNGGGDLTFSTQFSPKMIITSAGNVGIGTLVPSSQFHLVGTSYVAGKSISERAGAANPMFEARKTDAGAGSMMTFLTNGSITGEIATSGVATAYNTTSDIRLKENIKESTKGISDIMKIVVKEYNYKADEIKKTETGFIAQELYEIYPQAVHKGGEDPKTNPWMIDYSKLTPLLIKGMQDQQTQLKLQQEKIEKLEKQNAEILELLKKK